MSENTSVELTSMNQGCSQKCHPDSKVGYYHAGVTEHLAKDNKDIYQEICVVVSGCNPCLKYKKGKQFNYGGSSKVYHGTELSTGTGVAIKVMPINPERGLPLTPRMSREIQNMKAYQHPNIVKYLDSYILKDSLWIVMEYIDGVNLADFAYYFIADTPSLAIIMREVLKALQHLHNNGFMHRDIKPENILLGKNGQVKLADFGLSTNEPSNLDREIGTYWFMAPELIESDAYDHKIDIWSLGVTLIEMIDVDYPDLNEDSDIHAAAGLIIKNVIPQIENEDTVEDVVKDFLRRCLQVDSNLRHTASELLDHALMDCVTENSEKKLANLVGKFEGEMNLKCCGECSVM